jgi:C-terminal processing protease CtpA/Prc
MQRWARLEAEMVRLNQRVAALEQVKGPADRPSIIAGSISRETNAEEPATPPTEESRRSILVEAGVPEDTAEDIVRRQSEQALARLELRDQATREGWLGSDQYRQSLRELNAEAPDLRGEIDLYAYDRYLYATGEPNRVAVTSVIEGSAAQEAGLLPGDVILSYADERVFGWSDLNSGTTAGERGELVPVEVQREGTLIQAWLPRGPMGIRLESVSLDPDS